MGQLISYLKARKMISNGYLYHLVRVKDSRSETPTFESAPIVCEFKEVFSKEHPGVPPEMEIVFGINLLPNIQPISIPLYRMALVELKESKGLLKDLLDKGFIRPYVFADNKSLQYAFTQKELNHSQRTLFEFLKDYDPSVHYHPFKTSVTAQNGAESSLVVKVKEKQDSDPILLEHKGVVHNQRVDVISQGGDGVLCNKGRLCVPDVGATKMYRDLQNDYWWSCMKRDTTDFVHKYLNFNKVKIKVISLPLISASNFRKVLDDHLPLIGFAYDRSYYYSIHMAPYEALYVHRFISPVGWFEEGRTTLIGPDSVLYAMEKMQLIRDILKKAQSSQKSYADVRTRELEFQVDDWVLLKVLAMKGVMRF
ncbi:uncharacterized protein [Solanum lycopersicum]|uniref:uncharacterized protein n=1 Tax=Solanum lycopersicum TaxID=4081 RepID=UPI003748F4D1